MVSVSLSLSDGLCLTVSSQLGSYGGVLNYSLVYDIPLDNEDHSLPARSDVIIKVAEKHLYPAGTRPL